MRNWLCILTLLLLTMALAKPQPTPSLAEGLQSSPYVVVATFDSIDSRSADYLSGTESTYTVTQALKGKIPKGLLSVNYSFHDNSACLPIKGWKVSQEKLPKKGSKWILVLTEKGSRAPTYRGDFGRIPYTKENITKICGLLGEGC